MDGYGPEDMAIPEWRLIQNMGGEWAKTLGGVPGQFFNKLTDEVADELNLIVVDILIGRTKWGREISDAGPLCASNDAKGGFSIYGEVCANCPDRLDAPWSVDATERRTKCCTNYTILGIDLDHDNLPVILRAHGTSALACRQLITQLKMNKTLKGEYHRAIVNVKRQEKTTPYGPTFTLHPKVVELITDATRAGELKAESIRLLGTPIPLPEGRPDEEPTPEPLGYTPEGVPFYSEEEGVKLMEPAATDPTATKEPPAVATAPTGAKQPPAKAAPPAKEEKKEKPPVPECEPLDLNF